MKRKLVWIYILFIIIYATTICISIFHNKNIKIAVKSNDTYIQYKCEKMNIVAAHECLIDEDNKIEILGNDPYLVYEFPTLEVGIVTVSGFKNYSGEYKLYYAMDEPFSEDRVATISKRQRNTFVIGARVNSIRIDFEKVPVGAKYNLTDHVGFVVNENLENVSNDILKSVYIFMVYVFLSFLCFIYFWRKDKFLRMIIAWGYSIGVSVVWICCIFVQSDMLVNVTMLLVACAGLFLAVNNVILEEER